MLSDADDDTVRVIWKYPSGDPEVHVRDHYRHCKPRQICGADPGSQRVLPGEPGGLSKRD